MAFRGLVDALAGDTETAVFFSDKAEIAAILCFEIALARAQADLGLIPSAAADRIEEIGIDWQPPLDRVYTSMAADGVAVPVLVSTLRDAVGAPHADSIHLGATSQDAIDTGLMLRLKTLVALFDTRLAELDRQMETLVAEQGTKPLMAFTRMQAALPFTAADKIATWRSPLADSRERLTALAGALPIQLGGPIGTGSSYGPRHAELRATLARSLGLRDRAAWHSDRGPVFEIASALTALSGSLGKIGQDLALMAMSGAVALASGGSSSAMAHKQNPVGAELLIALGRVNAGSLGTLAQALIHENERSGAAWTLEWLLLPQMCEATGAALSRTASLLDGLRFNTTPD